MEDWVNTPSESDEDRLLETSKKTLSKNRALGKVADAVVGARRDNHWSASSHSNAGRR